MSSLVVMLNVVKYVWNDAKPSIDQIEKKQIKISITEPHEFLKGMLHVCSNIVQVCMKLSYVTSKSLKVCKISPSCFFVNSTKCATEHEIK